MRLYTFKWLWAERRNSTIMKTVLKTKVSVRGQVALPAAVRRKLDIKVGDTLQWQFLSDGGVRMSLLQKPRATDMRAMLGFANRFRKTRPSTDWLG